MAKQTINVGTTANDGTGDTLRLSQIKANDNFTELYDGKENSLGNPTIDGQVLSSTIAGVRSWKTAVTAQAITDALGHPVADANDLLTPVPANAVFTDTVYDDTALDGRVTALEGAATPEEPISKIWNTGDPVIYSLPKAPSSVDIDGSLLSKWKEGTILTAGSFVIGNKYRIKTIGTTDYTLIGATSNTVGIDFIATGVGTGTGTAANIISDEYSISGTTVTLNGVTPANGSNIQFHFASEVSLSDVENNYPNTLGLEESFSIGKNKFNKDIINEGGYLNTSGSVSSNATSSYSDYIEVTANETMTVSGLTYDTATGFVVVFYDANKVKLSTLSGNSNFTHTTPVNTKFVRFNTRFVQTTPSYGTIQYEIGTASTSYEAYGVKLSPDVIRLNLGEIDISNKLIRAVGDSIVKADGYTGFIHLIANDFGCTVTNKGDSGATITDIYTQGPSTVSGSLLTYQFNPATNLVIFSAGTNDFTRDLPLGTTADMTSSNADTLKGSLHKAIQWVNTNHPNCKVLVFTPIERSTNITNGIGLKLVDYRDAIVEVCDYLTTPYVDLFYNNLISVPTGYKYLYDGLHPHNEGYKIMFQAMRESILNIFE